MSNLSETQMRAALKAIEDDLNQAYAASRESLIKAEGDEKSPPVESSDDGGSESASAPTSSPDSAPAAPPAVSPPADAAGASAPPAAPPASAPAPGADPAAQQGGGLTVEALQAEYSQLPPEELDLHIQAALSAKEALMAASAPASAPGAGASASPGSAPGASPAPGPSAPASSSAPGGLPPEMPPAMKAEIQDAAEKKAQGGDVQAGAQAPSGNIQKSEDPRFEEVIKLLKSQSELLKEQGALLKEQRQELDVVQKVMVQTINKPMRKSLSAEDYAARTAEVRKPAQTWTPEDVKTQLKVAIASGKLSKSERDDVVAFYDGKIKADKLAPIIEKLTK